MSARETDWKFVPTPSLPKRLNTKKHSKFYYIWKKNIIPKIHNDEGRI